MSDGMSIVDALALWRRGVNVFPVPRPRPGARPGEPGDGKVPVLSWRAYQTHRQTEADVVALFSGPPMNLAVITGAVSGLVVVDCDTRDSLRWWTTRRPYTPWQVQTSRGFHLYYGHPGGHVGNRARLETSNGRLKLDIRADGGYCIGPGSIHASGALYSYAGDWTEERDALPTFWAGWLQRPSRPSSPRPTTLNTTGDVVNRARRYLAAVPVPVIGAGSDSQCLYAACRLVRGFRLCAVDAEILLWEWAGGRPGWTRDWIVRKVDHAMKYGTEPIGALR